MDAGTRRVRGIRAGFEQAHDEPGVTGARRADQRGRALRVFGVERKTETEHALDRFDVAERRGGRQDPTGAAGDAAVSSATS